MGSWRIGPQRSKKLATEPLRKLFGVVYFCEAPSHEILIIATIAATPLTFKTTLAMEFVHRIDFRAETIWRHGQLNNVRITAPGLFP
jgi:hypothetical protein